MNWIEWDNRRKAWVITAGRQQAVVTPRLLRRRPPGMTMKEFLWGNIYGRLLAKCTPEERSCAILGGPPS